MSTFGAVFRVTTFGESHCRGVGCIVDGVPPRMRLCEGDIQGQLSRRRPGQSAMTTARDEKDAVKILSGVEHGWTLGTPVALFVENLDQRPGDYSEMADIPRPSHADFTYQMKYGIRASSGGGRSSARETIGRVAAGAIAEKWLREAFGVEIVAFVSSVGDISLGGDAVEANAKTLTRELVDMSPVRCPNDEISSRMVSLVASVKADNDSIGGVITCVVNNVPCGWGEPCFDRLEASLAHAMLSIPATKGFEIGSGFAGTRMRGSQHNDMFTAAPAPGGSSTLATGTNRSGGVQGGISNGQPIVFRVAFKPPATIGKAQRTATFSGNDVVLEAKGRHDPCVVPRAVPIVEAMTALVLADAAMIQSARLASSSAYPAVGPANCPQ
ncbi:Chorismate synthase [Plasmodiophora brassicae]